MEKVYDVDRLCKVSRRYRLCFNVDVDVDVGVGVKKGGCVVFVLEEGRKMKYNVGVWSSCDLLWMVYGFHSID